MKLCELPEEEFREYSKQHPLTTFLQTPEIGHLREQYGWKAYYLGMKENSRILGASMVLARKNFLGKKIFYAPRGFLIDFSNFSLVKEFTKQVKQFVKEHGGYVLTIDPYLPIRERDIDGNLVENGFDHTDIFENLKKIGFIPTYQSEQVRFMFALDIQDKSIDEIYKNFRPNTRNIIKKTQKTGIVVRELTLEELSIFKKLTEETSQRKGFSDKKLSYYEDMYRLFSKYGEIQYKIAEIHLPDYQKRLMEDLEKEKNRISKLTDAKANEGKKKEILVTISSLEKRIAEAKSLEAKHGPTLVLSGGMFLLYGNEVIYLFSGNYKEFMQFNGQYLIQWEMIQYAIQHGFQRYNFYGITGNFDKSDKDYGMYEFKKGFNGSVIELFGELELPVHPYYHLHKILHKLRGNQKRGL